MPIKFDQIMLRASQKTELGQPQEGAFLVPPDFAKAISRIASRWRRRDAKKCRRHQHQNRKQ